jgi:hypothetical protein
MRTLLLSFLFLLFLPQLHAQGPTASECRQFRTGTFYAKGMPNVIIERDSLFQTERNLDDGTYVTMSIKWTSDCTYELRFVKSNKRREKKLWKKLKVLVITITYADSNDSYRFSASSPMFAEPVKGTIIRKK